MSTRTIIEINHDYLCELTTDESAALEEWVMSLSGGRRMEPPRGIRVLGERHHSETLKLTVK